MKTEPGKFLHMRTNAALLNALDDLRRVEADIPSRAEMIRLLVERAHKKLKK